MTNTAIVGLFLCFKLIYLKVTALLFPTSDFRHPVTTPALLYISQALTKVHTAVFVLLMGFHHLSFCLNPAFILSLVICFFERFSIFTPQTCLIMYRIFSVSQLQEVNLSFYFLPATTKSVSLDEWMFGCFAIITSVCVCFCP